MVISNLYTKWFAQNKPLRHYSQHLLVGLLGYVIIKNIFNISPTFNYLFVFLLATYLIDIDSIFSILTTCRKIPESKLIIESVKNKDLYNAAILATTYHKKINRLLMHNIIGLLIFVAIFIFSGITGNFLYLSISGGVLAHFIFDVLDDIKQVNNINNWLWPYFLLFRRDSLQTL